ncbi:MAG: hypothetical protein RLZZ304_711 [Actinomycetota bacterium]|jgi:hypothetical protein
MSVWLGVIIGAVAVYSWKALGAYVPQRFLERPLIARIASLLTVALLAGLIGIQGFTAGGQVQFDSRVPALIVAGLLTWLRVPFIIMVAVSAAVAALLRAFLGWA